MEEVSISINVGERVAIVGRSGVGKSVLLKTLAGLIAPNRGQLMINKQDFHAADLRNRAGLLRLMGMAFQKSALFDSLTCGENVAMPLREWGEKNELILAKKVSEFLEAVGIPHARDLFPDEISGGMQKRLAIARALALDPEILFYDDPTAGLDPITSRKIIDLIVDHQRRRNSAVIMVTNDLNRAFQADAQIHLLTDKNLILCGRKNETLNHSDPRVRAFVRGEIYD